MIDLETRVAQAVFAARLLEKALHEPTGWTMQWGAREAEATRTLSDDAVTLTATFPEACLLGGQDEPLLLKHEGVVLGARTMEPPGDGGFTVDWALSAQVEHV